MDSVLTKENFDGKFMQKVYTNSQSQTPFQLWQITRNNYCMQEILLKVSICKEIYQKALKVNLTFSFKPSPFNGTRL